VLANLGTLVSLCVNVSTRLVDILDIDEVAGLEDGAQVFGRGSVHLSPIRFTCPQPRGLTYRRFGVQSTRPQTPVPIVTRGTKNKSKLVQKQLYI
jgi:hypothetical protein